VNLGDFNNQIQRWGINARGRAWVETEIDFGSSPVGSTSATITDTASTTDSIITVAPSAKAATNRTGDDMAWDGLMLSALPGTGSFTVYAMAVPGPVVGKRYIQYSIAN